MVNKPRKNTDLSLDKCRELLGKADMSDEELETIRNALYSISHVLIDNYIETTFPSPSDE